MLESRNEIVEREVHMLRLSETRMHCDLHSAQEEAKALHNECRNLQVHIFVLL